MIENLLFFLTVINFLIYFLHSKFSLIGVPIDYPDKKRKFHKGSVLISGGLIFCINILLIVYFVDSNKLSSFLYESTIKKIYIFSLIFFIFGFIDDKFDLNPWVKFTLMTSLLLIVFYFEKSLLIKELRFSFTNETINLGNYSIIITLLCYLLFINAFNMFDGINLQSSIFSFSIILYFIVINFLTDFNFLIFPAIILFIFLNYKNKSFLGDGGCYLLSFIFGSYAIIAYNTSMILYCDKIFVLMMLPGIDMLRLFFQRALKKKSPFASDRDHIHHILLKKIGYKKTIITLSLIILFIFLMLIGNIDSRFILIFFLMIYSFLILKFRN